MKQPTTLTRAATAFAAASLFVGSAASAAPVASRTVDPLVAVSMLGTASSQAAVCAAGAASVAAAAQAAPAQPGCVLPVVDAPPPAPVAEVPPPAYVPAAVTTAGGLGIMPLLLGLAAVVGAATLLLEDGDDDISLPISPA